MRGILKVYRITKRSQGKQGRRANDAQDNTERPAKRARLTSDASAATIISGGL